MPGTGSKEPAGFTPMTEEQLRASTVGELKPLNGPIALVDYDPTWPALYAREAERIRSVLGDRVMLLEHAGSTSVPGLAAKPQIDIVLVVTTTADAKTAVVQEILTRAQVTRYGS